MVDILSSNLSYIKKYNDSLVDKITSIDSFEKHFDVIAEDNGEYNLVINGVSVHSKSGAQQESEKVFKSLPHNSLNSIHVIWGIGLGYLLDVFAQKALGSVILYEPDIETLRLVLEAVDLKDSISKSNVYIVSDYSEFEKIFESLFRFRSKVSFSTIDYYLNKESSNINAFKEKLQKMYSIYSFNFSYQAREMSQFIKKTIIDIDKKYNEALLSDNKDKLKNIPAIIVSAGPSLAKNVDLLKKYQNNALIFCVGTALKTLYKNGITPDFLNVIEKYNTSGHYNVPVTKDMVLISEPYTSSSVFDFEFKNRLLTVSLEVDSNRWFLEKANKELIPFETKGTVSYQALSAAFSLGCNPIILVGQDLAYTDGQCYSKGSEFDSLECRKDEQTGEYKIVPKDFNAYRDFYYKNNPNLTVEEKTFYITKRLERLNKGLTFVPSQDGSKLPTESGYALFLEYFKGFAKKYSHQVKLINSSIGGALIDGFETMALDRAMEHFASSVINKDKLLENLSFESTFDFSVIVRNLQNDIEDIKKIIPMFKDGQKLVKNMSNFIKRRNFMGNDMLASLKKAADLYVYITNFYTNNSRLLKMLIMKENFQINYYMKETNGKLNNEIVNNFYSLFYEYFNKGLSSLVETKDYLEIALKNLSEDYN